MKYYPSSETNGYFYEIAKNNDKDSINQFVKITPSNRSSDPQTGDPYSIIYNINNEFSSFSTAKQDSKQWILFELKNYVFALDSYLIISSDTDINTVHHLKNWRIYGSGNAKRWYLLDENNNSTELNDRLATVKFPCKYHQNMFFKYFLIYQHEVGFTGEYGFSIRRFDLFGGLIQQKDFNHLCQCTNTFHFHILVPLHFLTIFLPSQ